MIAEFLHQLSGSEMELAAIWFSPSLKLTDGRRLHRVAPGVDIPVTNGQPSDGTPTHRVVGCYGTIDSSVLRMTVVDLNTKEPQLITINRQW